MTCLFEQLGDESNGTQPTMGAHGIAPTGGTGKLPALV